MASTPIDVPAGFQYVFAALLSTTIVLRWQSDYMVAKARKAAGVPYPQLYAEKAQQDASKAALVFNCTQRAHQNTLENIPIVLVTTLIASLSSPVAAASACGLWSFARICYTVGYATGTPKNRGLGIGLSDLAQFVLYWYAGKITYQVIKAGF